MKVFNCTILVLACMINSKTHAHELQGSISTYLNHDRSFVSIPRVEVNFLAPLESAGSLCVSPSFSLSLSEQHIHCWGWRGCSAFFIRSEGLQVAERKRLITSSVASGEGTLNREMREIGGIAGELEGREG